MHCKVQSDSLLGCRHDNRAWLNSEHHAAMEVDLHVSHHNPGPL